MRFYSVSSSTIERVAYDPQTSSLYIKFRSGDARYRYKDVPAYVVTQLLFADSIGKHFQTNIKGEFEFDKLGPSEVPMGDTAGAVA